MDKLCFYRGKSIRVTIEPDSIKDSHFVRVTYAGRKVGEPSETFWILDHELAKWQHKLIGEGLTLSPTTGGGSKGREGRAQGPEAAGEAAAAH